MTNAYRNARANLVQEPPRYSSSPMFLVGQNPIQTLAPTGSYYAITLDAPTINDNGCFSPSTYTYTCQRAGRMLLQQTLTVINETGSAVVGNLCFNISGSFIATKVQTVPAGNRQIIFNSLIYEVNVGTTIRMFFLNDGSVNIRTLAEGGSLVTNMQGFYLT